MIFCSACLLGIKCRYDGTHAVDSKIIELSKTCKLIPICPEQLVGLKTPRMSVELTSDGLDVLLCNAKVMTKNGEDQTEFFVLGAHEVFKTAKKFNVKKAILKNKSPSCGCGKIYDGTFSGKLTDGDGVTTALLKKNGILCISNDDL